MRDTSIDMEFAVATIVIIIASSMVVDIFLAHISINPDSQM